MITGSCEQMGLEYSCYLPVSEIFPDRPDKGLYLLGMMGIIVDIREPGPVNPYVEASPDTLEEDSRFPYLALAYSAF